MPRQTLARSIWRPVAPEVLCMLPASSSRCSLASISPLFLIAARQWHCLRALPVASLNRQPLLPDIPALSEFLPGYEASGWYGIVAPKGTPPEIIDRLNKEIDAGLRDEKTHRRLVELGCEIFAGPPAAFGKFIADETEQWSKVVRAANIKQE